ncbi:MAG: hypothetical protein NTX53_14300 [candidate division WOR-3 bacterium]|nr:hypothetical protein [candidate division WOR-3 bacterium]
MKRILASLALLAVVASGQWVEKTIGLPDSLSGLRDPGSMLYNPGSNILFISGSNGLLLVDGLSNRVVARTPLTDFSSAARCYASQVNKVYWAGGGYNDNAVYSLDGASGRVLARVSVSYQDDICYNPVANRTYVSGGYSSSTLTVINAANDSAVRTLDLGSQWAQSLCCNPGDNKVYFVSYGAATVGVVDCSVDSIRRYISVGGEPDGLVYNRVSN